MPFGCNDDFGDQPVPVTPNTLDVARLARRVTETSTQDHDPLSDVFWRHDSRIAPHEHREIVVCDDVWRLRDEIS